MRCGRLQGGFQMEDFASQIRNGKWRILSGIYHEKENDGIVVQIYSGPLDRRVGRPEGKEFHCSLLQ